jgi:hypothetical protein
MDGTEEPQVYTLGGRRFRALEESTVEHDQWYMRNVRAAGLDVVELREGESPEDFAHRLLGIALDSGRVNLLIAGMIVPTDAPGGRWSPALAAATAEFIGRLSVPEDKRQVYGLLASLLASFFGAGLISSVASQLSSDGQPGAMNQKGPGASGPTSFALSPGSTRTARASSFAGSWWRRWWPFARSGSDRSSRTTATAASCGP